MVKRSGIYPKITFQCLPVQFHPSCFARQTHPLLSVVEGLFAGSPVSTAQIPILSRKSTLRHIGIAMRLCSLAMLTGPCGNGNDAGTNRPRWRFLLATTTVHHALMLFPTPIQIVHGMCQDRMPIRLSPFSVLSRIWDRSGPMCYITVPHREGWCCMHNRHNPAPPVPLADQLLLSVSAPLTCPVPVCQSERSYCLRHHGFHALSWLRTEDHPCPRVSGRVQLLSCFLSASCLPAS